MGRRGRRRAGAVRDEEGESGDPPRILLGFAPRYHRGYTVAHACAAAGLGGAPECVLLRGVAAALGGSCAAQTRTVERRRRQQQASSHKPTPSSLPPARSRAWRRSNPSARTTRSSTAWPSSRLSRGAPSTQCRRARREYPRGFLPVLCGFPFPAWCHPACCAGRAGRSRAGSDGDAFPCPCVENAKHTRRFSPRRRSA